MTSLSNDEIRARVRVVDAAERLTQVWPDGPNRWVCRCLCGRSADRTPSFKLWADHAHCFSCGQHIGNVFQLVMFAVLRTTRFDDREAFREARAWLLREYGGAGSDIGTRRPSVRALETVAHDEDAPLSPELRAVMSATVAHYEGVLWGEACGAVCGAPAPSQPAILHYLRAQRGLNDATIRRLRIGYSDNRGLARALYRAGCDVALAARAGLLAPEGRGEFLRERIVFPVFDDAGDGAVYLIGRATRAWQARTKYLGLPQTLLRKAPMVLGTPQRGAILVEGPLDFAALVQWGLDREYLLVCALGTAHARALQVIRTRAPEMPVCIATDMDAAGEASAAKVAAKLGAQAQRVRWAGAKDCGELLAQGEAGRCTFLRALHSSH